MRISSLLVALSIIISFMIICTSAVIFVVADGLEAGTPLTSNSEPSPETKVFGALRKAKADGKNCFTIPSPNEFSGTYCVTFYFQ